MELKYDEGPSAAAEEMPEWVRIASERIHQRQNQRPQLIQDPPDGVKRVLLHSCCAPCSGGMLEGMLAVPSIHEVVVFYYNPNVQPQKEYEIRKEENKKYCRKIGIEFVDCDYDADNWYNRMKGMEYEPERGKRCTACFDMRLERTALYAHEHGFDAIATTNGTSRWKDSKQVEAAGFRAVAPYPNLVYWNQNWQSDELTLRKYQIAAENKFYKQEYCGCSYSLRDSNAWRRANGIPPIHIGGEEAGLGDRYFSDPLKDAAEESQDVIDEFFSQADEIAKTGKDVKERKKAIENYRERRKMEAQNGEVVGLNNW